MISIARLSRYSFLLSTLALVGVLAGTSLNGCSRAVSYPSHVTLFVTGDSRGYLEPCGCRADQAGGLSGRATLIESVKPADRVVVDVGNIASGDRPYDLLKLKYMMQGMASIGYDAVNIGKIEAEMPLPILQQTVSGGAPFVSCNVLVRATGAPVAPAYRIIERGKLRIGVTGVAEVDPKDAGPDVTVVDPVQALAGVVPELKKRCDYLIVLAFTDQETIERIANQFPEVDCVLGGDVPQSSSAVEMINRAATFNVTDEGKVLGEIDLARGGGGYRPVMSRGIKVMGTELAPNAAIAQLIGEYKNELRDRRFELASAEGMERIPGAESTADQFVGQSMCESCHTHAHDVWALSGHAHAFATLVAKDSEYDPDCLRCHTLGYGLYSGYVDSSTTPALENVQCESCHGRGKDHVTEMRAFEAHHAALYAKLLEEVNMPGPPKLTLASSPIPTGTLEPVTPATCVRCHDAENSAHFHFATFWPKIAH